MVLDNEQCERFFDTMDALLFYVNDRFKVVEQFTLNYTGQIGDLKTALVAQALWDNVEIIDEFVRDNPFHLSQRHLDTARSWKVALPGIYTVVRYQNGRALMMNDRGVFSVCGVTNEIEHEIGKAPAYVDLVLIPFDDLIVYDGFLQAYEPEGTHEETTRIQDGFENLCAKGIISTAREFEESAQAYLASKRDDELDALLADVEREASGEEETLPDGFHRGALAGLDSFERDAAIVDEFAHRSPEQRRIAQSYLTSLFSTAATESTAGQSRNPIDIQQEQALDCAISSVLHRGLVALDEVYDQYRALAPSPLEHADFANLIHYEATFSDAYFGLWQHDEVEYLMYYTLTPDYIAQLASRGGNWNNLRDDLAYYESYKNNLLVNRTETAPKPLSRTLLENTPLGELLGNPNVIRLRNFIDERIPDGQDDFTFADLVVQELALTAIESGSPDEVFRLCDDLGLHDCTTDIARLDRLVANMFNAMPSWENNGWSPQELYEQLTGRRVFFNDDGTPMRVGADEPCPCGSGKTYRSCCGR